MRGLVRRLVGLSSANHLDMHSLVGIHGRFAHLLASFDVRFNAAPAPGPTPAKMTLGLRSLANGGGSVVVGCWISQT